MGYKFCDLVFFYQSFSFFHFLDIYLQLQKTHLIFHSVVLGLRPDPVRNFELESFLKSYAYSAISKYNPEVSDNFLFFLI